MKSSSDRVSDKLPWSPREGGVGPGGPELLRKVNARRVLRLLRLHGPCSRADLVRYSGLSAPTVSAGIAYLQKKEIVESLGPGRSSGGRPPRLLRFNSKLGYVVGVDIGTTLVRVALADLNGTVIGKWVETAHAHSTPQQVTALVIASLRKLRRDGDIPQKKLLALAAGVPGITDTRAGVLLSAPILPAGWRSVPLRQIFEAETGIPATIENDVNLAALGESWRGTARGARDFVFLTIGTGVGAGIFVNGHLYHGSDWAAGEIGYLYVPGTEETPLAINRPGSLESIIGAKGIERSWQALCKSKGRNNHRGPANLTPGEIFDLAEKGKNQGVAILQRTARILADAITNLCVILNSSLVVLGGRVGSHPALFEATRRIVERNDFCRPRLALSVLGREAPLVGAIWLALKDAEQKILPSSADLSWPMSSHGDSNFFQPFLGLPPLD